VKERTEFVHMGLSADLIATHSGIARAALDAYADESQRRAAKARDEGRFDKTMVPIVAEDGKVVLDRDELIRDTSLEKLAALWPAFVELGAEADPRLLTRAPDLSAIDHRHTLGTSPALADGACLLLFGDDAAGQALGMRPRARIRSLAHASVDPVWMLTGNVPATERALARAGATIRDVELFEVNESFAAIPIHYRQRFEIDPSIMNVNGGAIALGHPLGATGAMLLAALVDELERQDKSLGLCSICGGAGVAIAMVVERV
jgi:acetyl-CoA C-acetyltransferase